LTKKKGWVLLPNPKPFKKSSPQNKILKGTLQMIFNTKETKGIKDTKETKGTKGTKDTKKGTKGTKKC